MTVTWGKKIATLSLPMALLIVQSILSSIPGHTDGASSLFAVNLNPTLQNLLHIPIYATIQFVWLSALKKLGCLAISTSILCFFGVCLFGAFDEFHQFFVPGRYASIQDIMLNCSGAFLGMMFFFRKGNAKMRNEVRL